MAAKCCKLQPGGASHGKYEKANCLCLTGVDQQQADLFTSQYGAKLRRLLFFCCSDIRLKDVVVRETKIPL